MLLCCDVHVVDGSTALCRVITAAVCLFCTKGGVYMQVLLVMQRWEKMKDVLESECIPTLTDINDGRARMVRNPPLHFQ